MKRTVKFIDKDNKLARITVEDTNGYFSMSGEYDGGLGQVHAGVEVIEELELSVRAYNCLKRASINSMSELLKKSEHDLLNIKNFGKKSSDEVIERLHHFGLDLAPNPEMEEEIG